MQAKIDQLELELQQERARTREMARIAGKAMFEAIGRGECNQES